LIQTPIFKNRPAYSKDDLKFHEGVLPEGNYNLQGFSPTKGFFHAFIQRFRKAAEGSVFLAFMADNFFVG
jgi:hypothetical protein